MSRVAQPGLPAARRVIRRPSPAASQFFPRLRDDDMRHKKWILLGTASFLIVAGALGTLLWALLRVPDFYSQASAGVPKDHAQRQQAAKEMVQHTTNLVNNLQHEDEWSATFNQTEVNSWLVEELHQDKYKKLVPEGVSDPRVAIHDGRLQVGFRLKRNGWNGIVSLKLKPWMAEDNQLAIEIESIRAGIVPIPMEDMLHDLTKELVNGGWDISWNHAHGHDVVVINLSRKANAPVVEAVALSEGEVQIRGRRKEGKPQTAGPHNSSQTAQTQVSGWGTR